MISTPAGGDDRTAKVTGARGGNAAFAEGSVLAQGNLPAYPAAHEIDGGQRAPGAA